MNHNVKECGLAIVSKLPKICKPNEFVVAFFLVNTMMMEKKDRIKIYRGNLADLCNMSERNISRITERLNQIGIIQKELIGDAEKKKTYNYYRLNWQFIDEFFARIDKEESSFLPELSGLIALTALTTPTAPTALIKGDNLGNEELETVCASTDDDDMPF